MTTPVLSMQLRTFADGPTDWEAVLDLGVAADRAGIGRVVVSDHVVFGEDLEAYGDPRKGGAAGGRQPTGPDGHWLEPITFLSVLAGRTQRVRLGTNILIAALRRPVVLAKTLATLDVLSGGRVDLGVGVGWQREEYEAAGLSYEGRGRLLDHTLEVCETLWTQARASYSSPELSFEAVHQMPKPLTPGGVPIWVSGTVNRRSMRRLARFGSGWIPWGPDAADPAGGIARMRAAVQAEGRDPDGIEVTMGLRPVRTDDGVDLEATMAPVPDLVAAGVTDLRLPLPTPPGLDAATEALSDAVAAFDRARG
jgi:probable F420-dependent oxidoreductase